MRSIWSRLRHPTFWLGLGLLFMAAGCSGGPSGGDGGDSDDGDDGGMDGMDAGDGGDQNTGGLAVLSVSPERGPVFGGTRVSVAGRGFEAGARVAFGATDASTLTFLSASLLEADTPAASGPGRVAVIVRNPGGASASLAAGFEYQEALWPVIGWCNLQHPPATSSVATVASEPIYGRVYVAGCSEGAAHCQAVQAQLGWGPAGQDAQAAPESFAWQAASYNSGHSADDNDEYSGSIVPAADGDFVYAYRFSSDDGQLWTYCDLDGSDNGFQAGQQGVLRVAEKQIGWCNLQSPASLNVAPDSDSEPVYGRVYVAGCSEGAAHCGGMLAEVGHGPAGADPSVEPHTYQWFPASHNPGHVGDDNDEYQGRLHPMGTGTFRYAFRFSGDGGQNWLTCDLTGSSDGFSTDDLGVMDVQ